MKWRQIKFYNFRVWKYDLKFVWRRRFYHTSVETLSIGAWWKIRESKDFKYLSRSLKSKRDIPKIDKRKKDQSFKSLDVWEFIIYDSYIKYIGFEDDVNELTLLKVELHGLISDLIETRNNFIKNHIAIKEAQISAIEHRLKEGGGKSDIQSLQDQVKYREIDIFETTVKEYNEMVDYYTDKIKRESKLLKAA